MSLDSQSKLEKISLPNSIVQHQGGRLPSPLPPLFPSPSTNLSLHPPFPLPSLPYFPFLPSFLPTSFRKDLDWLSSGFLSPLPHYLHLLLKNIPHFSSPWIHPSRHTDLLVSCAFVLLLMVFIYYPSPHPITAWIDIMHFWSRLELPR